MMLNFSEAFMRRFGIRLGLTSRQALVQRRPFPSPPPASEPGRLPNQQTRP